MVPLLRIMFVSFNVGAALRKVFPTTQISTHGQSKELFGPALTDSFIQKTYLRAELTGAPVCGEVIPDSANATWAYSARDGSVITFTCDVGFLTSTGGKQFNFTCRPGEPITAATLPDRCYIAQCRKPRAMPHAVLNWQLGPEVTRAKFGDVVDYTCEPGFTGDGKARGPTAVKMICAESGDFEFVLETITSCLMIHCGVPLALKNAVLGPNVDRTEVVEFNQTLTYTCMNGFVSSYDKSATSFDLTCHEDGEFVPNDPLPRCTSATCESPPLLANAATIQASGKVNVGSRVLYRCADGYVVSLIPASSTFNVMCEMMNGSPQYVFPPAEKQCKPAACLPLPRLVNAHVSEDKSRWSYKEVAHFECDEGFALGSIKGEKTFEGYCNTQGVWTIEDNPKCARVTCAEHNLDIPPYVLEFAKLTPFSNEPIQFGMNTTVQCMNGAVVTGTNQRERAFELECGPDGDFTSEGICAVPCPPIPKVGYSKSAYFGKVIEFGEPPATIRCKSGYLTKSGKESQEVMCNRDGTLSPIEPCVADFGYHGTGDSPWDYENENHILHAAEFVHSSSGIVYVTAIILAVASTVAAI